jgi:hypothetical protein
MVGYVIDSLMFSNYKKRYIIIALHLAEKKKNTVCSMHRD